jgi:hypothetical protein
MLKFFSSQMIQFVVETIRFSLAGTFQSVGVKARLPSLMVLNVPVGLVPNMFCS